MSSEIVNEQFYQQRLQATAPQQQPIASSRSYNKGKLPRQKTQEGDEPSAFAKLICQGRAAILARSAQQQASHSKYTREIAALVAANHLIRASGIRTLGRDWFYYRKHFTEDEISRIYDQFQKWDTDRTGWIPTDKILDDIYAFDGIANSSKWREVLNRNAGNTISYSSLLGMLSSVKISPIARSPGKYFHQEQWTLRGQHPASIMESSSHHYLSMQEISLLAEFVNKMLEGNNTIQGILPLNSHSRVFFLQFKDGGLFCKLINAIKPGTIDETNFNFGNNMHFLHMVDNQSKVLKGAALLGCDVSGLDPSNLATYNPHAVLALLEQLFKLVTNRDVHMFRHYEMVHGVPHHRTFTTSSTTTSSVRPQRSASLDHKSLSAQRHRRDTIPALGFALQPDHPWTSNRKRAGEIAREPVLGFALHHERPKRIHSNTQPPLGFSLARDTPPKVSVGQPQQQLQSRDADRGMIQGTRPVSSYVQEYSTESSMKQPFIPADVVMMNWVNFQLRRVHKSINNFGTDLQDGSVYIHLLSVLAPPSLNNDLNMAWNEPNLSMRYQYILEIARKMGISPSISPSDLLSGNGAVNFAFIAMIYNMYGPPHEMMVKPSESVLSAVQQSDVLRLENECFSFLINQFKDVHTQLNSERNIRQDLEVRLNQFLTQEYLMNAENNMMSAQAEMEHEMSLKNRQVMNDNSNEIQRLKMHEKEMELQLKSAIEEATVAKQLLDQERFERQSLNDRLLEKNNNVNINRGSSAVSPTTTTTTSTSTTKTFIASGISGKDTTGTSTTTGVTSIASPTRTSTTTGSITSPTNNNINNQAVSSSPLPNERISNAEMEGDALLKGFVRWKKCYLILKGEYLFVFVKDMVHPKYSLNLAGATITTRTDTSKDWVIEVRVSKNEHLFLAFFTEAIWRGWTWQLKKSQDRLVKFSQEELNVHGQQLQQVQQAQSIDRHPQDEIKFRENSLWIAAALGDLQWCTALLDRGADPALPNSYGATSLHLAASRGHIKVVEYLLNALKSRGVVNQVINAHTKYDKSTALHLASKNGYHEVCALLLSYGADPMCKDAQNRLPSDMAPFDWEALSVLKRSTTPSTTSTTTPTTHPITTPTTLPTTTTTTTTIPSYQQQQPVKAYNYRTDEYTDAEYDFSNPQVLAEFGLEGLVSQKGQSVSLPTTTSTTTSQLPFTTQQQPILPPSYSQTMLKQQELQQEQQQQPPLSKLQQQQQFEQQLQAPQSPRIPGSTTPRRG